MKQTPWTIEDRKINIALVGCGRIAQRHFESIQQHSDNLNLTAICDNRPDRLEAAVKEHQVDGYTSLDELLQFSNADIVTLCTPSGLHADQTIKIAQSYKHTITEKPMATRWRDANRMIKACDDTNTRLFVVKQNRQNATIQALKKAIKEKRFGRINMAHVNVFWTRPQSYYDQDSWRGTWEYDGGAFMNQASHYVDLMHWLLGPVEAVQAMTGTLAREIQVEDTGVMNIKWRNGAIGSMSVTMTTYPKNLEGSITILGDKGTVRIGGIAVNEVQHWEFEDERPEDKDILSSSVVTKSVYGFGHKLYYDNIIKTMRGNCEAETNGREGLASLELLIAAYRSARDNRTIHLPLEL